MKRQLVPFMIGFLVALIAAMSAAVMGAGRDAAALLPPPDSLGVSVADSTEVAATMASGLPRPAGAGVGAGVGVPAMLDVSNNRSAATEPGSSSTTAVAQDAPTTRGSSQVAGGEGAPGTPVSEPAPILSLTRDSSAVVHERRLARTFGAMSPRDAARVLEQMSDADVATVLGYLNERQSAGILSSLPPTRAARLGELALRNHESN